MKNLRPIVALSHVGKCNDPGKAPEVLFLTLDQLVVNDEYQRGLSKASQNRVRKMAKAWDWNSYKALTVAQTDDPAIFEVIDGQHIASAAASNGGVHILPCLLGSAASLQDKARSFIGINTSKVGLTPMNIYKSRLAADDPQAVMVQAALDAHGCRMLEMMPTRGMYSIGDSMAVGTLLTLAVSVGAERLSALVGICKASGCAPISSKMLKALNLALPYGETGIQSKTALALRRVIGGQGAGRLEMIANSRTLPGKRDYETLADMLAEMAKLSGKRMGLKTAGRPGRKAQLSLVA